MDYQKSTFHIINLHLKEPAAESGSDDDSEAALGYALTRIEFLEQQFTRMQESILVICEHEKMLPKSTIMKKRPENDGHDLLALYDRLDRLEGDFGWMQNTVTEIQEYMGLETGYYPRLPFRWEGPPPNTFRYRGSEYYDIRPIVPTSTGPAGRTAVIVESTEMDRSWEDVSKEYFEIDGPAQGTSHMEPTADRPWQVVSKEGNYKERHMWDLGEKGSHVHIGVFFIFILSIFFFLIKSISRRPKYSSDMANHTGRRHHGCLITGRRIFAIK